MESPRSVAVAQTVPRRGDVEANLAEHLVLARAAGLAGARVVVFPELSLTGYELDLAAGLAFREDDRRLEPLVAAAVRHRVTLVAGAPVRLDPGLHVGAFLIGADGAVDVYTKHHLGTFPPEANPGGPVPPPEPSVFVPGRRNPLLVIDGHAAAVAVCADLSRPKHAEAAAARGAGLYLASTFVIPADLPQELGRLRGAALRHRMVVAFANFGGPSGGLPSAGASAIWSPAGELLVQLDRAGAGLAVAVEAPPGWNAGVVDLPLAPAPP